VVDATPDAGSTWAALDRLFSDASNAVTFTDVDREHLYRIMYQQADPDTIDGRLWSTSKVAGSPKPRIASCARSADDVSTNHLAVWAAAARNQEM
jgi:hypothetical protein